MIEKLNNPEAVADILSEKFNGYLINNDPFEKVATYVKDGIIGIISYSNIYERGEINYIVVSDKNLREGIGSKLLEYALADMNDCQSISLEVAEDNTPAIKLYSKYGFKKVAIRKNYYENKDAYLMVREVRK